jgi:hypothetical protein
MESISRRRALTLGGGAVLGAAGALTAAGSAGAATDWKRLVVVTANIGRNNLDQRERAIRDVRHATTAGTDLPRPLVGWQEIGERDDDGLEPRWINEQFGDGYRNIYEYDKTASRVPMSIPRTYSILERRVTYVHGGRAGVTPHRVITQALLERVADPKLRFVFANTHYVAGAWNDKEETHEAWREEMWRLHFRKHRDDVLGHWRSQGFPVIWTGDVNRTPMPPLLPNCEQRAFSRGIDHIGWVPGTNGTQIRLRWTKSIPMHVDGHDARVAVMEVRRA